MQTTAEKPEHNPFIFILGISSSGKSSLVRRLKGERDSGRDCFESDISEIRVMSYYDSVLGRTVTLVEAPGFDQANEDINDAAILNQLNMFFRTKLQERNRRVTGLIYIQPIDSCVALRGSTKRALRLVEDFLGSDALKNCIIATTSWHTSSLDQQKLAHSRLVSHEPLKRMVEAGAKMHHFDGTEDSAQHILSLLIDLEPVAISLPEQTNATPSLEEVRKGATRKTTETYASQERYSEEKTLHNWETDDQHILSLIETEPEKFPPSQLQVSLSEFKVIGLAASGKSITVSVTAEVTNGAADVPSFGGDIIVGYRKTKVGRAFLKRTKLVKGNPFRIRDFEVEFEPPTNANEDVQRLLQELILTDKNVPVKLVFPNPFYENDSKSPPFSVVASEISGIKCNLIKQVHVYIGIKVLTSKTLSFQFHFVNPFPVPLAICSFDIDAGKDGKNIARAKSTKMFRLRKNSDNVSERANDAKLTAGYIDAGRFLVGGGSNSLSIDLKINSAKILIGDFAMDDLVFEFPNIRLSYGKPGTKKRFRENANTSTQ